MNRLIKKFKKAKLFARILYGFVIVLYLVGFVYLAKNVIAFKIETAIRCVILVLFLIYFYFYILHSVIKLCSKKYVGFYINSAIAILLSVLFFFSSNLIKIGLGMIGSFTESETITYTSYLITLNETEFSDDVTLGMIEDKENIEGHILANKIIKENKLENNTKYYSDPVDMLYDLYNGDIGGAFVSNNYVTLYSSDSNFANIAGDTKVVYKTSDDFENKDLSLASNKSLENPISVLIMGVDSEDNGLNANAAFNGDTLILATFNPDTLNATLLSIPRDTFVPIACRNGVESKINSSAAYGTSCVINTVENLTGIDIDYYVKINFKGVVDLVDSLQGIDVNIEKPNYQYNMGHDCRWMICEQNSDRLWDDKTVYIGTGMQHLDGEQALAYARCRHLFSESDLARNRHQQDIILAIAKKVAGIRSYNEFKKVFDSVSNNIATNMSTDQILSGYEILKSMVGKIMSDEEFINIKKSYLETYNLNVYLPSGMVTYALGYYNGSLDEITKAMRINLGLEKPTLTKSFNYSINEVYEENIAGKNIRTGPNSSVIDDLVGKTKKEAEDYCVSSNLVCRYKYIDETSKYYDESFAVDTIAAQDPHAGSISTGVDEITFYIVGATSED